MRWRLPRLGGLQVAVLVAAVALLAIYSWTVKAAQDYYDASLPDPSVSNEAPMGLSVWYRYLGKLGLRPRRLETFDELPPRSVIVIAAPFQLTPTESEGRRLNDWVADGGRLVLLGGEVGTLARPLGLTAEPSFDVADETQTVLEPLLPSTYGAGVGRIEPGAERLDEGSAPEWVIHYGGRGKAAVLSCTKGRGTITWVASPYAVSNEGIGREDNATLGVLLAGAGSLPVYFDEYHQGRGDKGGIWDEIGWTARWIAIFAALAALVVVLAFARRLGPPIPAVEMPAARTAAYISTLADLYRRAGARATALESLEDGLKRALVRRHGSLERGSASRPSAADALARSATLRETEDIGTTAFLTAAAELWRARQEVEGRDG